MDLVWVAVWLIICLCAIKGAVEWWRELRAAVRGLRQERAEWKAYREAMNR